MRRGRWEPGGKRSVSLSSSHHSELPLRSTRDEVLEVLSAKEMGTQVILC